VVMTVTPTTRLTAGDEGNLASKYWPQWRGPTWNGVASQADPPTVWGKTKNVRWKTPIEGKGHGTPIVWGDRIFLQTAIPLDKKLAVPDVIPAGTPNVEVNPDESVVRWKPQRFAVVCIDRTSGKPLWSQTVLEAMPHQGHHLKAGFASQSVVTDGKHVYAYFGSYGLYCFDFDGRPVWKHAPKRQAKEAGLGEGSSPALFGDRLIIVVDHELQSYVAALDKRTGEEIWRQDRDEVSNWTTPRIFTHAGRRQVILNGAKVRSYDFATGDLLWECGGQSLGAIPMPAIGHGLAFATSGWRKDTLHAIKLGQRGDLTDSENVVWSLGRGTPYVPCPMLWGDELYLLEDRSFFSCLGATDGERHYLKHRLPGILNFSASPVGAADRIYLLSEEGKTVVLQRGRQVKVLAINELDEKFYASPAIVGEAIYLRSNQHLFCIARSAR
ncbi:MAG: PQQ-binding-like beta-propeller repeat protein, partial [Pirellulaceae bacterium]|nr:PQQ-binding-like beta-propeller repeat protein [Pirellulaceae bacterium]